MVIHALLTQECHHWREYLALCKIKVVALIGFTALVGMLLAVQGKPPFLLIITALIGICFTAAAAAVLNHVIDRKLDERMIRTARRPLPRQTLQPYQALIFASLLGSIGLMVLAVLINLLTMLLTLAALIGYAGIYTLYLKHMTPQNIVIGGLAGAAPPVLGWTAMTGYISAEALLLCLIIYTWTPPHFWALAIYRQRDYAKANIPMLPVTHGIDFTRLHILLYTVLLVIVTLLPYLIQMTGMIYLIMVSILNIGFIYQSIRLYYDHQAINAFKTFWFSIYYLMGLFAVLLLDHYLM